MKGAWRWPELVFEVLPIVGLSGGMSLAGWLWLGSRIKGALVPPLWVCLAGFYAALMVFKQTQGWNLGLLGIFALLAGSALGSWQLATPANGWGALGGVVGFTAACGAVGLLLGARLVWPVRLFWFVSWLYLIGWVILGLWPTGDRWFGPWAGLGVFLFGGLLIGWFAAWRRPTGPSGTSAAIDLYLLTASLGVVVMVLLADSL